MWTVWWCPALIATLYFAARPFIRLGIFNEFPCVGGESLIDPVENWHETIEDAVGLELPNIPQTGNGVDIVKRGTLRVLLEVIFLAFK